MLFLLVNENARMVTKFIVSFQFVRKKKYQKLAHGFSSRY